MHQKHISGMSISHDKNGVIYAHCPREYIHCRSGLESTIMIGARCLASLYWGASSFSVCVYGWEGVKDPPN